MRILVVGLIAALTGGCCSAPSGLEIIEIGWQTPRQSYETFRAALAMGRPVLLYESLSPGFKRKYGVPGIAEFKTGYQAMRGDFDQIADVLYCKAETGETRYGENAGRRYAFLTISAYGQEGDFVLVDIPVWKVRARIEGYAPEEVVYYLPGMDFSELFVVRDGVILLKRPLDVSDLGLLDVTEILALSFEHQWLLEDIVRLPIDVGLIMDRMGSATRP